MDCNKSQAVSALSLIRLRFNACITFVWVTTLSLTVSSPAEYRSSVSHNSASAWSNARAFLLWVCENNIVVIHRDCSNTILLHIPEYCFGTLSRIGAAAFCRQIQQQSKGSSIRSKRLGVV
jgi:hypothetical protein